MIRWLFCLCFFSIFDHSAVSDVESRAREVRDSGLHDRHGIPRKVMIAHVESSDKEILGRPVFVSSLSAVPSVPVYAQISKYSASPSAISPHEFWRHVLRTFDNAGAGDLPITSMITCYKPYERQARQF